MTAPATPQTKSRPAGGGSPVLIVLVALFLVGAAVTLALLGPERAHGYILALLGLLAAIGVFAVFAAVAGVIRFGARPAPVADAARAVADGEATGLMMTDDKGRIVYANAAYGALTRTGEGQEPRTVERAFSGDAAASEVIYRLAQAAGERRVHHEELRRADESGQHWFRIGVRPAGGATGTVWSITDITRERQSAETAFETLQRAIDFLDHAPAGFFSMEPTGAIVYLNATLANWLDYDLAQFGPGGLNATALVGKDAMALFETMQRKPGEVVTQHFDVDLRTRSGRSIPVRLLHKVAFAADGVPGPSRTLVVHRGQEADVPESLRAAEVRFSRFFNHSPLGIATVDKAGKIVQANPLFARMFAKIARSEDMSSRLLHAMVVGSAKAPLMAAIEAAVRGQGDIAPLEAELAGDAKRHCRFYVAPVQGSDGTGGEAAIVYAIETTEQRSLQEQFAQSQKMQAVGNLAGGVAHDFNNLLQAIIGHADLLLMNQRPTDPGFNDVMQVKQNANRAASLVRQLLAFSRKQTMRPQVVQLDDVVSDLSMMLRRTLGAGIGFETVNGRDLWPVRADVTQLEQVIINLCVNARDAMPEGGKLTIRTNNVPAADLDRHRAVGAGIEIAPGDYVQLSVADTGTGIPKELLQKIFDPFFTTKEVGKGTGLGLSTVYGIVKQSGGYVFVDSEPAKGTTFRVYLPRHDAAIDGPVEMPAYEVISRDDPQPAGANRDVVAEPPKPKRVAQTDGTGRGTVLLVEDEEAVRAFGARALTSRGYTVLQAASGVEALEVVAAHEGAIDLVVSDVVMPEMNGPTMLRQLREKMPTLKVIFVSGYAEDAFKNDLPPGETFNFLPKPFSLAQLVETVKATIGSEA